MVKNQIKNLALYIQCDMLENYRLTPFFCLSCEAFLISCLFTAMDTRNKIFFDKLTKRLNMFFPVWNEDEEIYPKIGGTKEWSKSGIPPINFAILEEVVQQLSKMKFWSKTICYIWTFRKTRGWKRSLKSDGHPSENKKQITIFFLLPFYIHTFREHDTYA